MNAIIDNIFKSEKKRKVIKYGVNGIFVICVFLVAFKLLLILNIQYMVSFSIAWLISNCFAYFTTRKKVFKSKAHTKPQILHELMKFLSSRVVTYFINLFLLTWFVEHFNFDPFVINIGVSVIIIVLNYFLSNLIIHKEDVLYLKNSD